MHARNFIDLTGKTFDRWTVIQRAQHDTHITRTYWQCRCKCGTVKIVFGGNLTNRKSRSCGCLNRELLRVSKATHGATRNQKWTPEYKVWAGILRRTRNPNEKCFPRYGGRGITCKWKSFAEFFKDMGPKPTPHHSIERRKNWLGYSKANCYWGTKTQQANNKRNNRRFTFRQRTQTIAQWAREVGLSFGTLRYRLCIKGWPIKRALTEPLHT